MTRKLFVCCTTFQIFNAINFTVSFKENDDEYDLVVCNHFPTAEKLYTKCKDSGIWSHCYYMRTEYNRNYLETMQLISRLDYQRMMDNQNFCWNYDEVYIGTFNNISSVIAYKYCKKKNKKLYLIDEGLATYLITDFSQGFKKKQRLFRTLTDQIIRVENVAGMYLYAPEYYCGIDGIEIKKLPAINRNEADVKTSLNTVFGKVKLPSENRQIIFFDQPLRNVALENKSVSYESFLLFLVERLNTVAPGNFMIKWHPRTGEEMKNKYPEYSMPMSDTSWEMYLLNEKRTERKTYITIFSSAALTGKLLFGDRDKIIFLYKLVNYQIGNIGKMMNKIDDKDIFIPETWSEFDRILQE